MSNKKLNNLDNAISAHDVFERFKTVMNFDYDDQIAGLIGLKKASISSYRIRNKIPFEGLFSVCELNNINFRWLLTGKGKMFISSDEQKEFNIDDQTIIKAILHDQRTEKIIKNLCNLDKNGITDIELITKRLAETKQIYSNITERLGDLEKRIEKLENAH